jgi:hypothetical protein
MGLVPGRGRRLVVLVVGVGAAITLASTVRHAWWVSLLAVAAMLAVIFLKGTSPGGPDEWRQFRAARDRSHDS